MLDRLHIWLLCAALALFPALASAQSPIKAFPPGTFQNRAALDAATVVGYQGPGDLVSGATVWGSTARAYNAAYANGTNPLADLVDTTTGTVAICTLRVLTTGFVDLTGNYCTGSTTPSLACAAAAGGACRVSKVYDQTSNGNHFTNATNSARPVLTFAALGGLPGMTCTNAANSQLNSPSFAISNPFSMSVVSKRTGSTASITSPFGENGSGQIMMAYAASTNTASIDVTGTLSPNVTASDNAFHALQGMLNGGGVSTLVVDGSATAGSVANGSITVGLRICRGSPAGNSLDGAVMEAGIWAGAFNSTQYGNVNTNQHSLANGYNF